MTSSQVPDRLRGRSHQLTSHWPGRIALGSIAGFGRLEIFDRSMSIAAQLFTSVFPILIMMAVWVGQPTSERLADAVSMPSVSQDVLEQAFDESGSAAFGVVGTLIVLVSATSLSRALTRTLATVWRLSRPKTHLSSSWRWLAVVLTLAISVVVVASLGRLTDPMPLDNLWKVLLTFGLDVLVAAFVPWLLLANKVPVRRLIPGAVTFALAMMVVRPASVAYLPNALEESADRYGTIGVAFTYLACLYVLSFTFLAAAIIGNVIAEDQGRLGLYIRRGGPAGPTDSAGPVESVKSAAEV